MKIAMVVSNSVEFGDSLVVIRKTRDFWNFPSSSCIRCENLIAISNGHVPRLIEVFGHAHFRDDCECGRVKALDMRRQILTPTVSGRAYIKQPLLGNFPKSQNSPKSSQRISELNLL